MFLNNKSSVIVLIAFCLLSAASIYGQSKYAEAESQYYSISTVPIPKDVILEVGGLAFDDKGRLGVTTRRGELWLIDRPGSNQPTFNRYAQGLHEPLGLAFKNGSFYFAQRGELTKATDINGDGKGDHFESIYTWDLAGNYHEYAYGPKFLPSGNMLITLNLGWIGRGASLSKWSGWMLEVSPKGDMTPIATGMRSPAGFGFNEEGDVFYTENQGDWVGSGRMTHIEKGVFVGHPEGLKWSNEKNSPLSLQMSDISDKEGLSLYDYGLKNKAIRPPSVWFPHTLMGISTSDVAIIPDSWGPYTGQLLIGDQGHSKIMRVYQEKINGVYQGACFPFKEGFSSGILRLEWGADEKLYVGMTSRGWAATGKAPYGLQRLEWTGKTPFDMKQINITADGFIIHFTQPVNRTTASQTSAYSINDFTYLYHHLYGSPPTDIETRTITRVEVADDNKSARLYVDNMRPGYVYEIKIDDVRSANGAKPLHGFGFYTINQIPERVTTSGSLATTPSAETPTDQNNAEVSSLKSKRVPDMPTSWVNGPEQTIEIEAVAGMLFDKRIIRTKAGTKIRLVFNNPDDMVHNLLIVNPGTADKVGEQAMNLGLRGEELGFIPDSDDVIAHTALLRPGSSDIIYLTAPLSPGRYQYVCTFPAHAATMRGLLIVE